LRELIENLTKSALLAACAVALLGVLPSSALAAPEGDATVAINPINSIPSMGTAPGKATCPTGTRVVGGGVTQSAGTPNQSVVQLGGPLDASGQTANLTDGDIGRSWYTQVFNGSASPASFVATALCSAKSDATIKVAPFTVPAGTTGTAKPTCSDGSRLIGGGVTQSAGGGPSIEQAGGPLDKTGLTANLANGDVAQSWYTAITNNSTGSATFVATAICSPTSDATIAVAPFAVNNASGHLGSGKATCVGNTRVVGGGVTQSAGAANQGEVKVSGPLDQSGLTANLSNGDVATSFYSAMYYPQNDGGFVSTAICAPPPSTTPKAGAAQTCHGKPATIGALPGEVTKGTSKADVIVGTSGKDKINAGAGNDIVCAGGGADTVKGGSGKDELFGQGGNDKLLGQGGKDLLSGGAGHKDDCVGGPGRDTDKSC
jgi:Ca2+-binding RTX toxin-like protein